MTSTVVAVSQSQSLAAIRNFVRASISCITYARGLCSDSSYESRPFLGMELKHMVPASTEAITISEWIEKGAFDALNKNYLKEMALCVHNADCTEQLESYCFAFTYTTDGQRACMTVNSTQQQSQGGARSKLCKRRCTKDEVQQALSGILTRLLEMVESLPPLLSERVVTMRLTYYDEVTPEAYQPPCFAPASERMVKFYKDEQKHHVGIGAMDTSHHLFAVSVRHPLLSRVRDDMLLEQQRQRTELEEGGVRRAKGNDTFPTGTSASVSTWTADDTKSSIARETHREAKQPNGVAAHQVRTGEAQAYGSPSRGVHLTPEDLTNFTSLYQLVCKSQPLRTTEVAYLLLVAFLFARCAPALGGRGRLTAAELQDHLRESCALDIAPDAARAVVQKLVADGYLQCEGGAGGRKDMGGLVRKSARTACGEHPRRHSCAAGDAVSGPDNVEVLGAAEAEAAEWSMPSDPPIAVVVGLLGQRQVVDLLSPTDHMSLATLRTSLERQAKLQLDASRSTLPAVHHHQRRDHHPRMSCAESRKRKKDTDL